MTTDETATGPDPHGEKRADGFLLLQGDACALPLGNGTVDAVVCDPPYGLEFMGQEWDAPWTQSGINTDAGFNGGGISATKGAPSFTSSTNPNCLACGGKQRGRRDGTAIVAVCLCESPRFPNVRAVEMAAFQAWCVSWATEALRVLRPGGHLLAFGGSRTWHRLAAGIEDAGFELRDSIAWLYGSGFPKSLDVSKAIDKAAGAEREVVGVGPFASRRPRADHAAQGLTFADDAYVRPAGHDLTAPATPEAAQWEGWGTALKPAFEPILVARKPLVGTVAANVLAHGTGALNIDACRTATDDVLQGSKQPPMAFQGANHRPFHDRHRAGEASADRRYTDKGGTDFAALPGPRGGDERGRWPTNVVLDGDQADELDRQTGILTSGKMLPHHADNGKDTGTLGAFAGRTGRESYGDSGGASRFFPTFHYEPKAPAVERPRNGDVLHPTVKPLDLMRWLVRLVTHPGGVILDPFMGSGTTIEAAVIEGFQAIGIERNPAYLPLSKGRMSKPLQAALFGAIA